MAGPKGKPAAGAGSDEMKFITMKVVGGEPPSNAVLSAKLAPFGCNPKKAGETISKGTTEYTNIRIYVKLSIQSREIKNVEIIPTCSAHIIKALKEPKRQRKKENLTSSKRKVTYHIPKLHSEINSWLLFTSDKDQIIVI